ncbi:MAG: RNA polymerase sigma factor [Kangiellaceae bacterium]
MNQAELDLLVLTAQQGNKKAFGLLFKHFQKPLTHFAYKLCNNKELANDATQETWIKVSRNIRQLNDQRAFRSWLYKLLRWNVIDYQRKNKFEFDLIDESITEQNIDDNFYLNHQYEEDETLSLAINSLPTVEKQIIHLFYLQELKITEISIVLDIAVGTIKSRLNRARKMLKQKYHNLEK